MNSQNRDAVGCLIGGVALYALSFLMPAVRLPSNYKGNDPLSGYVCAVMTLGAIPGVIHEAPRKPVDFLYILAGFINPLAWMYLVLLPIRNLRGKFLRRAAGVITLVLIPATWIIFLMERIGVEIGHIAWVAGLVMMILPDIFDCSTKRFRDAVPGGPAM